MIKQSLRIENIPAILWGEKSDKQQVKESIDVSLLDCDFFSVY